MGGQLALTNMFSSDLSDSASYAIAAVAATIPWIGRYMCNRFMSDGEQEHYLEEARKADTENNHLFRDTDRSDEVDEEEQNNDRLKREKAMEYFAILDVFDRKGIETGKIPSSKSEQALELKLLLNKLGDYEDTEALHIEDRQSLAK